MRPCDIEGCGQDHRARGLCDKHYTYWRRHGRLPGPEPDDEPEPLPFVGPGPWRAHAACRGLNPELFFPGKGEKADEAIAVCEACPVTHECIAEGLALPSGADMGIRGGLYASQRRELRKAGSAA